MMKNIKKLIHWSKKNFSDLPWRTNRSLYRTLVSEVMLQQTTVSTVKNHFERFLTLFPDLSAISRASEEELLIAWKGLGYYRRVKNLKKMADFLSSYSSENLPSEYDSLLEIPGIGPYTASALLAIGMQKKALAVDANLERVIARLFDLQVPKGVKLQKEIQSLFMNKKIFDVDVCFRELNEALMDLGRTLCQARKVSCELCPLKDDCASFLHVKRNPLDLPLSSTDKSKKTMHELHLLRLIVKKDHKILVYQKNKNEWLSGQFEVPTLTLSSSDPSLDQYPCLNLGHEDDSFLKDLMKNVKSKKSFITKYKIKNMILEASSLDEMHLTFHLNSSRKFSLKFPRKLEWKSIDGEKSNLTSTTLKILNEI